MSMTILPKDGSDREDFRMTLDGRLVREGARRMAVEALEAEVAAYLA